MLAGCGRDLLFFTVVEGGGMAKAGAKLGVSAPSISETVADLEQILYARLLDRPKGCGGYAQWHRPVDTRSGRLR